MKIALINDQHFGARSDNVLFYKYFDLFLNNIFFPTIEQKKVEKIIHLGDFFDRRKYINYNTLQYTQKSFLDRLTVPMDLILGNHDTYYKNTNDLNSPSLILKPYENIRIFDRPTEVDGILYLPWINSSNHQESMNAIAETTCDVAMGHLEVQGYIMFSGAVCQQGLDAKLFSKFEAVYSGHFHTKNTSGNIHYLGSPWDLIFTDADDVKGFHIYDNETRELEFIQNPYKMYWKLYYDDISGDKEQILLSPKTLRKFKDSYVKVYVKSKKYATIYDRYVKQIQEQGPAHLILLEDFSNADISEAIAAPDEDTLTIIKKSIEDYSDLISNNESKKKIEDLLTELYVESLKE